MTCVHCGQDSKGRGWFLQNYHKLTGHFCGPCYDMVSHNSYGHPENPGQYMAVLLKQIGRQPAQKAV